MTRNRCAGSGHRHGSVAVALVLLLNAGASAQRSGIVRGGVAHGGPIGLESHPCIQPWERAQILMRIAAYEARYGPLSHGNTDTPVPLYGFFPQAGKQFGDLTVNNFVDLDPGPGILTFDCLDSSYDGHNGIDSDLAWRDDQLGGVPVFAVLDGTVIDRDDGHPDQNSDCDNNPPANYAIIDHGNGRQTYYWHMKNGSVSVAVGQAVAAGQQIGLTASSGCSSGPHLHFESHQDGSVLEPWAGPCRPGPSAWLRQVNPPPAPFLIDFGITTADLSAQPGYPIRYPTDAQVPFSNTVLYYWGQFGYMPIGSTWQFIFERPDGSTSFTGPVYPFNNTVLYRHAIFYFTWDIAEMHAIAGTWHVHILMNGQQLINAPVEVVQTTTPGFNRPPQTVGLAFDPPAPAATDPVLCRIQVAPGLGDLDWDLVRYHYVWKRNGSVVRDVISVGLMDALAKGTAASGDIVECTVTPNDGHVDGASTTARVAVGCYANCDASSTPPRLNVLDFTCFLNRFAAGDPWANCDNSTVSPALNVLDFGCFLNQFSAGCS